MQTAEEIQNSLLIDHVESGKLATFFRRNEINRLYREECKQIRNSAATLTWEKFLASKSSEQLDAWKDEVKTALQSKQAVFQPQMHNTINTIWQQSPKDNLIGLARASIDLIEKKLTDRFSDKPVSKRDNDID